jgi:hypothetical protein
MPDEAGSRLRAAGYLRKTYRIAPSNRRPLGRKPQSAEGLAEKVQLDSARSRANRWHLDEMVVRTAGERMYLWRAVDHEGRSSTCWFSVGAIEAALRLMGKLLKKQGFAPKLPVTDKLRSCASAFRRLGLTCRHEQGLRMYNRAENSHQVVRRRQRKLQRFKSARSDRCFLSMHEPAGATHPVKLAACRNAEEDSFADAIGICLSVGQAQRHAPGPPEQRPLFDWSVGADLGSSRSRSMSASKSDVVPLKGQEGVASVRRAASAATLIEEDETVAFGIEIASPAGHRTGARAAVDHERRLAVRGFRDERAGAPPASGCDQASLRSSRFNAVAMISSDLLRFCFALSPGARESSASNISIRGSGVSRRRFSS